MQHSEQLNELAAALSTMQSELKHAPKDSKNPFFKSNYADLATVWDTCRPLLAKNGLSVSQTPGTSDTGGVTLTTMLLHKSGQWLCDTLTIPIEKPTPQAMGSAITYGRRYALSAIVGVAADDDDGEAAENHASTTRKGGNIAPPQQQTPRVDNVGIAQAMKAMGITDKDAMGQIIDNWLIDIDKKNFASTSVDDRRELLERINRGEYDSFRGNKKITKQPATAAA